MYRLLASLLVLVVLAACAGATHEEDRYVSPRPRQRTYTAVPELRTRPEPPAPPAHQTRKAPYEIGYNEGIAAERKFYQRSGHVWPERLRRPNFCIHLPHECGDVDGRLAFLTAVREGREPCAPADTACEPDIGEALRRKTEERAGWREGYANFLFAYHENGLPSVSAAPQTVLDCRAQPRACGVRDGAAAAYRALDEGREACADRDHECARKQARAESLYAELAQEERESFRAETAELRRTEEETYQKLKQKKQTEANRIRLERAKEILALLTSEDTTCDSYFGARRMSEKEQGLQAWEDISSVERKQLQDALRTARGTRAPNLEAEAGKVRNALKEAPEAFCMFGF